ncbi:sensor histidine kinase [Nocardioides okcheonensis]|uniref:sensor histidine kinase n=1 Tax=Nocardioides okcheonensis TaxID=2894081 RepID=UPI001E5455E8|nr:HAMP domain-containing sensor histidine kinase [Nocardioides okcheonensis]UFN44419.1 HAMP domain-containing histidine kinase [Nocardioides okcheonensis]
MSEEAGTRMRPRGRAWGDEAQRALLHAVAEEVVRRSGYRVAAIEALRPDGNLEFVAVAGSAEARAQLLGQAAPLRLDSIVSFGIPIDGWLHIPEERVDEETREWMAQYGHTPDGPDSDLEGGWHTEDRMVRLLRNPDGDLRATLYLDEPLSGLRPTLASVTAMDAEIEVMFDAIVGLVERELYGEHVRMVTQARTALRGVRPGLGVGDFLREMSDAMVAAMEVDHVAVLLAGSAAPDLEPDLPFMEGVMRRVWLDHGHVIVEPTQTWGISGTVVRTHALMVSLMERHGLESLLLVPIGMGEDYLGTLGMGRSSEVDRWTASEIHAASTVAADLATMILDARVVERERELNAELRALSDYRHDMIFTLAHELRNPVSVLWANLELIEEDGPTPEMSAPLAAIERAARRVESMVEDLMALGRVEGLHPQSPIEVPLSDIVLEAAAFLSPMGALDGVGLEMDVADGLVVEGEPAGLQRLVTNLLSNAFKYTPGGGTVSVALQPAVSGGVDGVRLTVGDTGIGISADEVAQVFHAFFRSQDPAARRRPGTGLGLAVVDRVTRLHDGQVDVASVLGEGTTFTVWLPLRAHLT